ncbi:MAG: all-trans-retinol 13,14-reductase, partial [Thermoleophilaceae bacterium]|nr:all-trans-retinol 13,14-reductase [Thermoleophilaceae bacterium]
MTTRSENAPTRTDWDVVVVGAGVGGLSTAAYLATNGKRVLVLEASKVVGGASQSFRRNRVFDFDCGAHYVGDCEPGGVIPTVLRGVGLEDEVHFTSLDPDRFDRLIGPDGFEFEVPRGWDEFESRLIARFPAETDAVGHVLSTLRGIAEATRTLGGPPAPRPMDVLKHPRATIKLAEGIDSLEHLFDRHDLSDGARTAIGYLCMFLMQPRSEIAAAVYA